MTKEQDIYQLIEPEYIHKNVVSIDSAKDVPSLVEHIVEEMTHFSWEATYALDKVFLAIFAEYGPIGAVVVKRIKKDKTTILDIHILWNQITSPTEEETAAEAGRLNVLHQNFKDLTFLPIQSELHFIAPTRYKTVEQLQAAIPTSIRDTEKVRVLGTVNAVQKSISVLFK
jgi:hypothetical protein